MRSEIVFSVVEIKALGQGLGRRLSVRLDGEYEGVACAGVPQPASYTIHAVLPFSAEYGTLQIGQQFKLTPVGSSLG